MKTAFAALLCLLLALVPATAAQDDTETRGTDVLHLTGLTKLNAGVVDIAIEGIAHRAWHCVECGVTQADTGQCPSCKQPLMAIEETLLYNVVVDVDTGTLHFDVLPGKSVKLSEIAAALTRFKITIPPEQQVVPHSSTLVVTGPASKDEVTELVTALTGTQLFEKLAGRFDETGQQAQLEVRCVGSPPRPEVEKALTTACASCKLADIVWSNGATASTRRG